MPSDSQYEKDNGMVDLGEDEKAPKTVKPYNPIMEHFVYEHLPVHLAAISKPICKLAECMDSNLPHCPEKSAGLRKLLEAKDCFVRANM